MRALAIRKYGPPEVAELLELPEPALGDHDLLVEIHAASVNPVDFKIRDGKLKPLIAYPLPLILGNDLSGVVRKVGPQVTRFKVGDAVFARMDKQRIGTFAELAAVREADCALKPENLSHEEAASIPLAGLTAYQALVEISNVQPGQKVFIQAGSGGVGSLAIQLAKLLGATVATTCGTRNVELCKRLGADVVIDYRSQDFATVLRDQDMVFDSQAGSERARSFQVMRRGGTMVSVGGTPTAAFARSWGMNPVMSGVMGLINLPTTIRASRAGVRFVYLFMHADGGQLATLGEHLQAGRIKPLVDKVFPLEQGREALAYVETGRATGKVIIKVR